MNSLVYSTLVRGEPICCTKEELMYKDLTQKQEGFTLDLYKEVSEVDAYKNHYDTKNMSLNAIYVEACRLKQNPKVTLRLSELRQKAEDATVATVLERKQVLTEILRARQTDFMTCSADGVWMHDIGEETLNKAGLKKIRTTTMPFGDKDAELKVILTEVELIDPVRAIEVLSKLCGDLNETEPPATVINSFVFVLPNGTRVTPKQLKGYEQTDS